MRIRVPEIQDHPWLAKHRLFRTRLTRKLEVRKSRATILKRKSQLVQLLLPINSLQLEMGSEKTVDKSATL
mgnify:FL=1